MRRAITWSLNTLQDSTTTGINGIICEQVITNTFRSYDSVWYGPVGVRGRRNAVAQPKVLRTAVSLESMPDLWYVFIERGKELTTGYGFLKYLRLALGTSPTP